MCVGLDKLRLSNSATVDAAHLTHSSFPQAPLKWANAKQVVSNKPDSRLSSISLQRATSDVTNALLMAFSTRVPLAIVNQRG